MGNDPVMTDAKLLMILQRDGPLGVTYDRDLIDAIATAADYMVAGTFIPTDEQQALDALKQGTGMILWRYRKGSNEAVRRDRMVQFAMLADLSVNTCFVETFKRTFRRVFGERLESKLGPKMHPAKREALLKPPIANAYLDSLDAMIEMLKRKDIAND